MAAPGLKVSTGNFFSYVQVMSSLTMRLAFAQFFDYVLCVWLLSVIVAARPDQPSASHVSFLKVTVQPCSL